MSNQYIVEGMYRGFAAGDVAVVVAAFADDFAWTEADGFPLAGTSVGPQAVVENVFMRLGEFSDNGSVSIDRYIADGDTVVADGRYTWNHKETGEPCEVRMAHIWTFEDGKAKSFLQHVDSKRLQEQVA